MARHLPERQRLQSLQPVHRQPRHAQTAGRLVWPVSVIGMTSHRTEAVVFLKSESSFWEISPIFSVKSNQHNGPSFWRHIYSRLVADFREIPRMNTMVFTAGWRSYCRSSFSHLRFINKNDLLNADLPLLPSEFESLVKKQCWEAHETLRRKYGRNLRDKNTRFFFSYLSFFLLENCASEKSWNIMFLECPTELCF